MLGGLGSGQSSAPSRGVLRGGRRLGPAWVPGVLRGGQGALGLSGAFAERGHVLPALACHDRSGSVIRRGPEGLSTC